MAEGWRTRAALALGLAAWLSGLPARAADGGGGVSEADAGCSLPIAFRPESRVADCTACHQRIGALGHASHRVDVEFAQVWAARQSDFRPPSSLPPEVVLVNGRVVCTTCHDPASQLPMSLALPVDPKPRLCLSCHRFD